MTMRSHIDRLASLKETEFMIATDNFDAKYSSPAERLTLKPNVINRKSEAIASRRRIAKSGGK